MPPSLSPGCRRRLEAHAARSAAVDSARRAAGAAASRPAVWIRCAGSRAAGTMKDPSGRRALHRSYGPACLADRGQRLSREPQMHLQGRNLVLGVLADVGVATLLDLVASLLDVLNVVLDLEI